MLLKYDDILDTLEDIIDMDISQAAGNRIMEGVLATIKEVSIKYNWESLCKISKRTAWTPLEMYPTPHDDLFEYIPLPDEDACYVIADAIITLVDNIATKCVRERRDISHVIIYEDVGIKLCIK